MRLIAPIEIPHMVQNDHIWIGSRSVWKEEGWVDDVVRVVPGVRLKSPGPREEKEGLKMKRVVVRSRWETSRQGQGRFDRMTRRHSRLDRREREDRDP